MNSTFTLISVQGGGSWGCFPSGALYRYFNDLNTKAYDGGFGVSVGALIISMLMSNSEALIPSRIRQWDNVQRLKNVFLGISKNENIYTEWESKKVKSWIVKRLGLPKELELAIIAYFENKTSIYDTTPLYKLVYENLKDAQWHPSIKVGTTDLGTGDDAPLTLHNNKWLSSIIASTAIPFYFPPHLNKVDGGVIDMTPIKAVFDRFREYHKIDPTTPKELHIYRCSPIPKKEVDSGHVYSTLLEVMKRTFQILVSNIDKEDMSNIILLNDLAEISLVIDSIKTTMKTDRKITDLKDIIKKFLDKYHYINTYIIAPSVEDMKFMPKNAKSFDQNGIHKGFMRGEIMMERFLQDKESFNINSLLNT